MKRNKETKILGSFFFLSNRVHVGISLLVSILECTVVSISLWRHAERNHSISIVDDIGYRTALSRYMQQVSGSL